MSNNRLEGAAALVTGGGSGIGFGLARLLVEEGVAVTLIGRREARLKEAAAALGAGGGVIHCAAADVSDDDQVAAAVASHADRFGRLDVLINNAGVALPSKPGRQPLAQMRAQIAVDFGSVPLLYAATLDLLLAAADERGRSFVVNLASLTGRHAQPWLAVYSATKAAVISYTASMNQAFAGRGLVSTAVCPGYVDTPMSEGARDQVPDEMIPVDDIVELVRAIFRLSPRSYVPEVLIARSASKDPSGL